MRRQKVISIVGTRPEVIKMAPVIRELERRESTFEHLVVATAQHREMLDQALGVFGITPDVDLGLMGHNQGIAAFAARALASLSELLSELKPDVILIQGDTTTVMAAALAAFYGGISVGHVEAGLRSFDKRNPFPEEINRCIAGCVADMHFAPTERARQNLLQEGVPAARIFVTGNTVVDALRSISVGDSFEDGQLTEIPWKDTRMLLVTAHRRENQGLPLLNICKALKTLTEMFDDVEVVFPVHLNPNVTNLVRKELGGVNRIHLVAPTSYRDLLRLMARSYLILTDSGGIQEEAPSFHKPVLVLRDVTERPELIDANAGKIVGTEVENIVSTTDTLLRNEQEYARMITAQNPFGDGRAAERIADILAEQI